MQRGSILVLTLVSVIILSVMAITGLTVSDNENRTTQNYFLNKSAYYTAVEGVEIIRNTIYQKPEPDAVLIINKTLADTTADEEGITKSYMTGSFDDLQNYLKYQMTPPSIDYFQGFKPPPFPGVSLGSRISISPVVWHVRITARVQSGSKSAYTHIESGIYSILTTGY
jgi:hypothetical protein